jgi:capsular polysaccharide biosynthesis protein
LLGSAVALGLLASLVWMVLVPSTYRADADFLMVPEIPAETELRQYPVEYYRTLLTEFRIDDFTQIAKSRAFAELVRREMGAAGASLDEQAISSAVSARKKHRTLQLSVRGMDPAHTLLLAQAIQRVIEQHGADYFAARPAAGMRITTLNPALQARAPSPQERALELVLRLLAALVVALGAVVVLEYTNDTLRDAAEIEQVLEFPVVGQIPLERGAALRSLGPVPQPRVPPLPPARVVGAGDRRPVVHGDAPR